MLLAKVFPFNTTRAPQTLEASDPKAVAIQQFGAVLNRCETLVTHSRSQDNKRILTGHLSYLRAQMGALENSATDGDRSRILSEITDFLGDKFMAPFEKSLKSGKFKEGGYLDKLFTQLVDGFNGLGGELLGQNFDNGETLQNKLAVNGLRSRFRARVKKTVEEPMVFEGDLKEVYDALKSIKDSSEYVRNKSSLSEFVTCLFNYSKKKDYSLWIDLLENFANLTFIFNKDKSRKFELFVKTFLTHLFPLPHEMEPTGTDEYPKEIVLYGPIAEFYGRLMSGSVSVLSDVQIVRFFFPFKNVLPTDNEQPTFPRSYPSSHILDEDLFDWNPCEDPSDPDTAPTDFCARTVNVADDNNHAYVPFQGPSLGTAGIPSTSVIPPAPLEHESAPHTPVMPEETFKIVSKLPPIRMPRLKPAETEDQAPPEEGLFELAAELAEEDYTVPQHNTSSAVHAAFFGGSNEVQKKEGTDFSADSNTATPLTLQAEMPTPSSAPASTVVPDSQFVPAQRPKLTRSRSVLGGIVLGFGLSAGQAPWTVAPIGECVDVETSTLPDEPTSEAFVPLSVKVANQAETVEELERAVLGAHDWKEVRSAHPWIENDAALTAFTRDLENWGGWEKPLELYAKAEKNGAVFSSPSDLLAFWDASPELAQGTALSAAREIVFELRPEINSSLEPVAELHEEASRQYIATGDGAVPFMLDQAQFESDVSQDALEQDWFDEGDSMEAAETQTAPVQSVRDRVRKFFGKLFS